MQTPRERLLQRCRFALLAAVAIAVGACTTTGGSSGPAANLAGTRWVVTRINGSAPGHGDALTTDFGVDGRVNGNSGCNSYSGPYIQTGSTIQIGELLSTRRACIDADRQRQEGVMLKILHGSTSARMDHGQLNLSGADGSLVLAPGSSVAASGYPKRTQFDCDGVALTVVFDPGRADLTWSDGHDTLLQREAASGIWYESSHNALRGKQDLTWTQDGRTTRTCRELH